MEWRSRDHGAEEHSHRFEDGLHLLGREPQYDFGTRAFQHRRHPFFPPRFPLTDPLCRNLFVQSSHMRNFPRLLTNEWFWLLVIVAVFVAAVLLWETQPCNDGFYWEESAGCVRD